MYLQPLLHAHAKPWAWHPGLTARRKLSRPDPFFRTHRSQNLVRPQSLRRPRTRRWRPVFPDARYRSNTPHFSPPIRAI